MIRSKSGKRIFALTMICIWAGIIAALVWVNGLFGIRGIHTRRIEPFVSVGDNKNSDSTRIAAYFFHNGDVYVGGGGYSLQLLENQNPIRISTAFGNSHDYSTDPAYIVGVTRMGAVYSMQDYDEDFRLMVETIDNPYLSAGIYERLNGIWLKYGKDLYIDRIHLDTYQTCYIRHATDSTWNQEENRIIYGVLFQDTEIVDEFLNILYRGRFLDDTTELEEEITNMTRERDYYLLSFLLKNGFGEEVRIYPNGYTVFSTSLVTLAIQLNEEDIAPLLAYYESYIG